MYMNLVDFLHLLMALSGFLFLFVYLKAKLHIIENEIQIINIKLMSPKWKHYYWQLFNLHFTKYNGNNAIFIVNIEKE